MQNTLAKEQRCIVFKSGFEIWVDVDKVPVLTRQIQQGGGMIEWEGNFFNVSNENLVGIFSPETMEERTRRKNGQWKCQSSTWHDRFEKCTCGSLEERTFNEELTKAINECEDYDSHASYGWIRTEKGMAHCPKCSAPFFLPNGKPNYAHAGVKRAGA